MKILVFVMLIFLSFGANAKYRQCFNFLVSDSLEDTLKLSYGTHSITRTSSYLEKE